MPHTTFLLTITLPEDLHAPLEAFLATNPDWDSDRVFSMALAGFLMAHSTPTGRAQGYRSAARVYLDELFRGAV